MDAKRSTPAPGPDLLARYLTAYLNARQAGEIVRPWGLGDEALDGLFTRLTEVLASDPQRLNRIVSDELTAVERGRIVETLAPLIFALPLRSYPAELRAIKSGPRLVLRLRHLNGNGQHLEKDAPVQPAESLVDPHASRKKDDDSDNIGYLPAALIDAFASYLKRVFQWSDQKSMVVTVSSGGRRRRVRVRILAQARGVIVRFLERLDSPAFD